MPMTSQKKRPELYDMAKLPENRAPLAVERIVEKYVVRNFNIVDFVK